jgi:hypothetical protein
VTPNERIEAMSRLTKRRTLATVLALSLAAGGTAAGLAQAQGASSEEQAAATQPAQPLPDRDAFLERVAAKLGVDLATLKQAMKDAALEQIDADLAAGRITEQRAADAKARIEAGEIGLDGFGGHREHGGPGHFVGGPGPLEAAAGFLGLSTQELFDAKANGKTVAGLKKAILDDATERLDQAVSDGRITSAQKADFLSRLESHIDDLVEGTLPGPFGFGRPGDLSGAPLFEAPQPTA